MSVVPPGDALHTLWPRVWALTGVDGVGGSSQPSDGTDLTLTRILTLTVTQGSSQPSDGTDVWFIASQCGADPHPRPHPHPHPHPGTDVWFIASQCGAEQLNAPAPAGLADEALEEWLKWFARG